MACFESLGRRWRITCADIGFQSSSVIPLATCVDPPNSVYVRHTDDFLSKSSELSLALDHHIVVVVSIAVALCPTMPGRSVSPLVDIFADVLLIVAIESLVPVHRLRSA